MHTFVINACIVCYYLCCNYQCSRDLRVDYFFVFFLVFMTGLADIDARIAFWFLTMNIEALS